MAELTLADLQPAHYQSSRALFDVLTGEDSAFSLIEASTSGDVTALRRVLSQPQAANVAREKPRTIYYQNRPRDDENDVREVSAMPMSNLERAIIRAASNGHAEAVSILLSFTTQQGIKPSSVMTRWAVIRPINHGHAAVLKALAFADPTVVTFPLGHGTLPLDQAVARRQTEVVAVLLELGADFAHPDPDHKRNRGYMLSLLSRATLTKGTRMTELFLKHGAPVPQSGALHLAAEFGALDTMRLLMQHGADVNELLAPETLPRADRSLYASWTPMHFAASAGQADAMTLLESNGARSDGQDENGKTPAQLLEAFQQASSNKEP